MGISQQIGASSAIKAGVCTSSTRPASPFEGQVIYETDTDLTYVWSGSAWISPSFVSTTLSGTPTAPTAALGTSTTQIATTEFVAKSAPQLKVLAGTNNSTLLVNIGDKYQLVYNNEYIDVDGEYNPSTSTFTCANTGVYLINIQTSARLGNGNDDYKVYIRKNATDSQPFTQGASSGNAEIDMFIMHRLSLTAGDTVKIYAVNQGAYTNRIGNIYTENAWWKIERIS